MKTFRSLTCACLLLCIAALATPAFADDNCLDQQASLKKQWQTGVVVFGSCYNLGAIGGDWDGLAQCGKVIDEGGDWWATHSGSRMVAQWFVIDGRVTPLPDIFYLGYCAANKSPPSPGAAAPATKAGEAKKQIQDLIAKKK